jgi:HAD superfamily hydrolase (TIGR01549 family)
MFKLIILDFDGVIVESADIKTEAFRKLFSDCPEHVGAIVEYHKKHVGVSRYEKFSHIYETILKRPLGKEKMAELGRRFSALVLDEIKACPLVPGALEFLEKYSKRAKLFIASSTPEEELRYLVKARGLEEYFKGAYGAPLKKSEIISRIMKKENVKKEEILFVGDSTADYAEAKKVGVSFLGRVTDPINSHFPHGVKTVLNLIELSTVVKRLLREDNKCRV